VCENNHLSGIASGQVKTPTIAKNAFIAKGIRVNWREFPDLSHIRVKKNIDI